MTDLNPVWILVVLAVGTALVKGLFWLRDVHTAKEGWARFTTEQFPAFAKEIRDRVDQLFERIPLPKTLEAASPLRLSELGETISKSMNAAGWAARVAPNLVSEVAGKQPFEIDRFSDQYVETQLDDQDAAWVAKQAYESGVIPGAVRAVLRVVLRDELIRCVEQDRILARPSPSGSLFGPRLPRYPRRQRHAGRLPGAVLGRPLLPDPAPR